MKAITIKQPWASLIVEGIKDVENRTWATKFRGRVLIHASQAWGKQNAEICISNEHVKQALENLGMIHNYNVGETGYKGYSFSGLQHGAIIGSVEIVDCVINHPSVWAEMTTENRKTESDPEDYEFKTIYNWVLANPIKFDEPIHSVKGKLSFWEYNSLNLTDNGKTI